MMHLQPSEDFRSLILGAQGSTTSGKPLPGFMSCCISKPRRDPGLADLLRKHRHVRAAMMEQQSLDVQYRNAGMASFWLIIMLYLQNKNGQESYAFLK